MRIHLVPMVCLSALLAGAWPAVADMEKPGKAAQEEDPRARLAEIDNKIAALEQEKQTVAKKAEEAEQQAHQREEMAEFQRACKERLQEVERQLTEAAAADPGDSAAHKASQQGQIKWLRELRAALEQVVAVQDLARQDKLRSLRESIEDLERDWGLVRAPQLEAAVRIEELERHVAREGTQMQKDLLARIKALAEDDAVARRNEFDAAKARRAREKTLESLVQQFWKGK